METKLYIDKRSVMDSFFTHYIAHRFEKTDKDNTEFRIVKQYCDRTHMEELLEDLAEKACMVRLQSAKLNFFSLNNFYFGYGVVCGGKSNAIDDIVKN